MSAAVQPEQVTASVLRLHWPFGRTVVLGLVLAAAIAGVVELAARNRSLRERLPPETFGGGLVQLDRKLVLLGEMVERQGPVDCLFVGSSQVYRGIDPEIVDRNLRQAAGEGIRSFNFGLGGMSETSEPAVARILLEKFHPTLMVVGASSYGLHERKDRDQFESHLATSPWFRYQGGDFSVGGWLSEHSVAFRQYSGYLFWREQTGEAEQKLRLAVENMSANGFGAFEPGEFRGIDRGAIRALRRYQVSPDRLASLSELLRLRSPGLELLVVELPVSETALQHYGGGEFDHQQGLDAIEKLAAQHGVPFWRFPADRAIPADGWADFIHLNRTGAEAYSRWLGEQLREAVQDGRLKLPPA